MHAADIPRLLSHHLQVFVFKVQLLVLLLQFYTSHLSFIKDVLAKTDFLDTPPPAVQHGPFGRHPPPRQRMSNCIAQKASEYIAIWTPVHGRGGGELASDTDSETDSETQFFHVCGHPVDSQPRRPRSFTLVDTPPPIRPDVLSLLESWWYFQLVVK